MSKVKLQCPPWCPNLKNRHEPSTPKGWYCHKGDVDLENNGYGIALRRDKGCEYERGEKE